jgi:hypothetical protein
MDLNCWLRIYCSHHVSASIIRTRTARSKNLLANFCPLPKALVLLQPPIIVLSFKVRSYPPWVVTLSGQWTEPPLGGQSETCCYYPPKFRRWWIRLDNVIARRNIRPITLPYKDLDYVPRPTSHPAPLYPSPGRVKPIKLKVYHESNIMKWT